MRNTNLAYQHNGDGFVLGSATPITTEHDWTALRQALALADAERVAFFDDFLGDLLADEWAADVVDDSTVAVTTGAGGVLAFTCGATDNDHATLALGLQWSLANGPLFFEARILSVSAITLRAIEVGVTDALTETDGQAFSNHATPTAVADDAVIFGYDTDASMTTFNALAVNDGGTPQKAALTAAPSTAWITLGLAIDSDGTAYFYVDGEHVATLEEAIATDVLLTPWISLKSLSGAAKVIHADYVLIHGVR